MLVLHAVPDFASFAIHIVLTELGTPFRLLLLDMEAGDLDSPEHRAVSPFGKIPALQTPDGPMFETAAILLWLADRHAALAPAPNAPDRAEFLSWFFRTNFALHVGAMDLVHPYRALGDAQAPALSQVAHDRLQTELAAFEALAARKPDWFSPDHPSILTYYVAMLLRWIAAFAYVPDHAIRLTAFPHLTRIAERMEQRPAAIHAATVEGMSGTFFSNP
jgi:glutathione S-transferase